MAAVIADPEFAAVLAKRNLPFSPQGRAHAWCGAGAGWVGRDPTNGIIARNDHIVLAIGRDYADVAPMDGVIIASG